MFCPKHPTVEMRPVCGEPTCGMCFAELMEAEKLAAPKPLPVKPAAAKKPKSVPLPKRDFELLSNHVRAMVGLPPLFPE
jgi:hypothetical protein